MPISDFYGEVSVCTQCSNSQGEPMPCTRCKSRGYVASCKNCDGKGQVNEPVAGTSKGLMFSTCAACGGIGCFGVNRPADFKEPASEEKKVLASA